MTRLAQGDVNYAVSRDNVIFEAGYFANSKRKDRVLIIREDGAKMPADLGGNIYVHLSDRDRTASIEGALRDERRL
jgi:predicted nucleotide-binding protein